MPKASKSNTFAPPPAYKYCFFHPSAESVAECSADQNNRRLTVYLCKKCSSEITSDNLLKNYKIEKLRRFKVKLDQDLDLPNLGTVVVFKGGSVSDRGHLNAQKLARKRPELADLLPPVIYVTAAE